MPSQSARERSGERLACGCVNGGLQVGVVAKLVRLTIHDVCCACFDTSVEGCMSFMFDT